MAAILMSAGLVACEPAPPLPPPPPPRPAEVAPRPVVLDRARLAAGIERHFASSGQISAGILVEVRELGPSLIGDLQQGKLRLSKEDQEQEIDFLVSADGRWFLNVTPVDLSIDPIARVIDLIELGPDHPYLGPEDAPVTVVEYSDFQCPWCARAENVVHGEVLEEFGDQVRFVYKQRPMVEIHDWSFSASEIGLCVLRYAGNEAYWKYHAAVFDTQRDIEAPSAAKKLMALAAKFSQAEAEKVAACFASHETAGLITATMTEADALEVNSTPTFFINGRRLAGAQPRDAFAEVIQEELGR